MAAQRAQRYGVLEIALFSGMFGTGVVHVGQNNRVNETLDSVLAEIREQKADAKKLRKEFDELSAQSEIESAQLLRHGVQLKALDELTKQHDLTLKRLQRTAGN
jgi:hypothetical protein